MQGLILTQFTTLGLKPEITNSLAALGFETPTPIQEKAIPLVLEGHDLMGLAQTGTGKTAAFGLPLIHHLLDNLGRPQPKTIKALILAPTRELVNQIATNLRGFTRGTPLRVACIVGGSSIGTQIRNLSGGTDILVATPGRLLDLVERKAVILNTAKFLVLDEADQMLDLGFIHALRKIATLVGRERQTMLFSATMPKQIEELSRAYLTDPKRVEVASPGKAADKITQSVHFIDQKGKVDLLRDCLSKRPDDLSLVFSRTKHGAEKLMKQLVADGFKAGSIHGNKSQGQRDRAIKAFKSGEIRILVATDVAARGIDISGVSHVYNYELPEVPENYVHRIGRTARAGAEGEAVAFCSAAEVGQLKAIERLMGITITVASGERPYEERAVKGRAGRGRPHRGQANGAPKRDGAAPKHKRVGKPADAHGQNGRPEQRKRKQRRSFAAA
jgi:ATP-dependent RNA helicase RhlE